MNPSASQRKYLRGLAHPLKPMVMVGHEGVTDPVLAEVERALEDHELIKIRFNDFKEEKKQLCDAIIARSGAVMAGMIGHVAILYRPRRDPSKRRIRLP
ncbi:MAG: ribosome assembly RNA-binding protein YhbY [Magnetococcales bacterium]|nr:ribosome assembly RNA-binding protein YhbY [Magnetococcales bacterium]